ncbi:hypothetical protein APHAL10511_006739 [Amanita phalloides]|nr:hypothetical protein APHAL10511_006739 [Amanita phalloides]
MSVRSGLGSKHYRPTNSVKVSNISALNKREIIALFSTLIGEVCGSEEIKDCGSYTLKISFRNRDAAMKALCMTGYTVSGTSLKVSPVFFHGEDINELQKDDRRNLYVLGLPFSLTKAELFSIFACYGTVTHCVILATLDNSSRRRGFVVMSTHEEARQAMATLTCTQLKGHTLDISWAVVQRSQGFLDGGDRSMALDPRPSSRVNFRRHSTYSSANLSNTSLNGNELDSSSLVPSSTPTSTILVSNLPTLLFGQLPDLHPLFVPFGPIKDLQVIENLPGGSTSVIVIYATAAASKDAKECLAGQCYGNFRVEVCYVCSGSSNPQDSCGFKLSNKFTFADDSIDTFHRPPASGLVGAYYNAGAWQYLTSHPESGAKHDVIQSAQMNCNLTRCSSSSTREV